MIQLVTTAAVCVFPALMVLAALSDVATMTIPNRISLALVPTFFVAAWLSHLTLTDTALHAGVGFAALALGIAGFAMGWLGGGDAKLIAAACLWVGPAATAPFLVATAFAGGVLALGLLGARQVPTPFSARGPEWLKRLLLPQGAIPYGVAIAAGALFALPNSGLAAGLGGAL